ncbi:MAG: hypothetical protein WC588_00985 [Candidatus Micrarchaeia archaeon]
MENGTQPKVYKAIVMEGGRPKVAAFVSASQISKFRECLLESGSSEERQAWREHRNSAQASLLMAAEWALENELAGLRAAKGAISKEMCSEKAAIAQMERELANCESEIASLEKGIRKRMRDFEAATAEIRRCYEERKRLEKMGVAQKKLHVNFELMFETLRESPAYFLMKEHLCDAGQEMCGQLIGETREEWAQFGRAHKDLFPQSFLELCRGKLSQYEADSHRALNATISYIKSDEEYSLLTKSIEDAKKLEKAISKIPRSKLRAEDKDAGGMVATLLSAAKANLEPIEAELQVLEGYAGIISRERAAAEKQFDMIAWFMGNCGRMGDLLAKRNKAELRFSENPEDGRLAQKMSEIDEQEAAALAALKAIKAESMRISSIADEKARKRKAHALNSPKEDMRGDSDGTLQKKGFRAVTPESEPAILSKGEKIGAFIGEIEKTRIMQDFAGKYPNMMENARQMLESLSEIYIENAGTLTYNLASQRHPQHTRQETGCISKGHTVVRIGIDRADRFRIMLDMDDSHMPVLIFAGCKGECERFLKNGNYANAKKSALESGEAGLFGQLL